MTGPIDVRLATVDDDLAVSAALARAFADDPLMEHLVPERRRDARMERFFRFEVGSIRPRGRIYTTPDRAGAALWAEPGRWQLRIREVLASAPTMAWVIGTRFARGLRVLSQIEARHPTDVPHWYLGVLGTDPAHQGKGVGSALLAPVLDECDRDGVGAYLESSKESNIPFYARHGFEVTEEIALPGGPSVWGMWRDPRTP